MKVSFDAFPPKSGLSWLLTTQTFGHLQINVSLLPIALVWPRLALLGQCDPRHFDTEDVMVRDGTFEQLPNGVVDAADSRASGTNR